MTARPLTQARIERIVGAAIAAAQAKGVRVTTVAVRPDGTVVVGTVDNPALDLAGTGPEGRKWEDVA